MKASRLAVGAAGRPKWSPDLLATEPQAGFMHPAKNLWEPKTSTVSR